MKQPVNIVFFIVVFLVAFTACQKEYSYETGNGLGGSASGTLQDSLGSCQNILANGNYVAGTILSDSNYIKVQVNITTAGKYKIYTDTVNGCWFMDSAYVLSTGTQTLKLKGYGKPILPQISVFTVFFGGTFCQFVIDMTLSNTDYFPNTYGSSWTYNDNYAGDTVRITATSSYAGVSGGNVYQIFAGSDSSAYYYRKDGAGNYYEYGQLVDSSAPVEYIFLEDYLPLNGTWDSPTVPATLNGVSTSAKYHFTIVAKNASVNVNGNANKFDSVITVQTDWMYLVNGTYQTVLTEYSSYAKKIGWIDDEVPALVPSYSFTIFKWNVY